MAKGWQPPTSPKQNELRALCHPDSPRRKKFVLANGCRFSTKTMGCLHVMVENAWTTPRGNSCFITISQTVGLDSGVWKDFTEVIIPQWIDGNFGLEWYKEPYIAGVSKKPTCEIFNRRNLEVTGAGRDERKKYGCTTTIQLESLKVEEEAEDRFKPRRYSAIYVPELSTFRKRNTFTTWSECLRHLGLASDKHLFLADTNPSDEGEQSWIYKVWFTLLDTPKEELKPEELALRDNLARLDFTIDDNIFDTKERLEELKSKYYSDEDLYKRYVEGKWVRASEDALFHKVFRPSFHIVGQVSSAENDHNPEILVPEKGCFELITGHDPGTVNYGATIIEKTHRKVEITIEEQKRIIEVPVFKQLDELVITGDDFDLVDFIEKFVEKMCFWEKMVGHPISWKHWSDRSVFDMKVPFKDRMWVEEIYLISGGKLELMAADRGKGSVNERIGLFRKLLFHERWFCSAERCPKTIEMCKSIKKGTTVAGGIAKGSVHKHIFDGATYPLASECFAEIAEENINSLGRQNETGSNFTHVSV